MIKSLLLILGGIVIGYFGSILTFYIMDRRDMKKEEKRRKNNECSL